MVRRSKKFDSFLEHHKYFDMQLKSKFHYFVYALLTSAMLLAGFNEFVITISDFANQWYWLLAATIYAFTLNDTFMHRICSHNMFPINVKSITYKVLTFLGSVNQSYETVRDLVVVHRYHHYYSDQGAPDNINHRLFWHGFAWSMPFAGFGPQPEFPDIENVLKKVFVTQRDIMTDTWTYICWRYSLPLSIVAQVTLYFLCPILLFKVILMGRLMITFGMIAVSACHRLNFPLNYRNFETKDESCNNLVLHYLFLGFFAGMLQNNHHGRPKVENLGMHWYEIDSSWPILKLLRYLMEKK